MIDLDKNVKFAWQLVAQFVSWDFCRYACQETEKSVPEPDILTFLRNMFVERTEKAISEVTKHEIIAKFILEIKAVRSLSRLPCILALSETVQKICPELQSATRKLLYHLESLLNILDSSNECQNVNLVELRLEDAVSDFTKEANNVLPQPELLHVIQPWIYSRKEKQKPYNHALFDKVLLCLKKETISPVEAKLIAVALCNDKVLQQMVLQGDWETETEMGSEPLSVSVQSSQLASQQSSQESRLGTPITKHTTTAIQKEPIFNQIYSTMVKHPVPSSQRQVAESVRTSFDAEPPDESAPFTLDSQQDPLPPVLSRFPAEDMPFTLETQHCPLPPILSRFPADDSLEFGVSSREESESSDVDGETPLTHAIRMLSCSGSDTSDCDNNSDFHFLTPTLFKEDAPQQRQRSQTVLSDFQSTESSISTVDHQKDLTWTPTQPRSNAVKRKCTGISPRKKVQQTPINKLMQKQPNKLIPKKPNKTKINLIQKQPVAQNIGLTKQKKKLFTGIHNYFAPQLRNRLEEDRIPDVTSRVSDFEIASRIPEIAEEVEVTTEPAPVRKPKLITRRRNVVVSSRMKTCKECGKTYKSALTLKRHIFLKHPPPDSEDSR